MKIEKRGTIGLIVAIALFLLLSGGQTFAANGGPMTPELAAKREMVRKQEEQRITPEKRKAAVEALKAKRMTVYQARQSAKQLAPVTTENK